MELHLNTRKIELLNQAQRALLSPLCESSITNWQRRANEAVEVLLAADHAIFWFPDGGRLAIRSDDVDPVAMDGFRAHFRGFEPGRLRTADELVDEVGRRRSARGAGAYHESELYCREDYDRSPFCQEFMRPFGLRYCIGMRVPTPTGEAALMLAFEESDAAGFGEEGMGCLQLLVPALEAGAVAQHRLSTLRHLLGDVLEGLGQGVLVRFPDGSVHCNPALTAMLSVDPEGDQLSEQIRALAVDLLGRQRRGGSHKPTTAALLRIRSAIAEYRLSGSYLDPTLFGDQSVLLLVERRWTALPTAGRLRARFGLTPRQIEVARLMADGLTSLAIAERLCISHHTARRHEEEVRRKLGVRSRAAVALTMLREV